MKSLSDSMDFLGIGTRFFGQKSSSFSTTNAQTTQRANPGPGLKALTAPSNLNRSCINRMDLVTPLLSSSSPPPLMDARNGNKKQQREFPPPIPLLARTGNLPCHMPWVLKRCYGNGRLVLREVPVKHHEFFKADRSNGRLVLRIMYMANDELHPNKDTAQNDDNAVDQDVNPSTPSLHVEENEVKSDFGTEEDVIPPMPPTSSPNEKDSKTVNCDVGVDAESLCHEEKGQGEEVAVLPMIVQQKEQPQHKVIQRVWTESRIYSSSMPCSPKDGINDFFRIGTPTIRPISS